MPLSKPTAQPKRVALYARVSTLDKGQDPETQLRPLREYAQHRGFVVALPSTWTRPPAPARSGREYKTHDGGGQEAPARHQCWSGAMTASPARPRRWSMRLKEFQNLGVDFISYQENIDTTTPTGELIFHVMASLAQFESALISQRVRAGMARAKAQGKHVARPRLAQAKQEAIAQLLSEGLSMNQVSKQLDVAYGTVYNYAQKLKSA